MRVWGAGFHSAPGKRSFSAVRTSGIIGHLALLLGSAGLLTTAWAQLPNEALIAAATTSAAATDGKAWVHLQWDAVNHQVLQGRAFAVYTKPGAPTATGSFGRVDIVTRAAPTLAAVSPWVARGAELGDSTADLGSALNLLTGNAEVEAEPRAEGKLAIALRLATNDPEIASALDLLARRYHAVSFVLGLAWAGRNPIGPMTLELREFDLVTRQDRQVIARITLSCGTPTPLPKPAAPLITRPNSPADDLRVGLLWSEPDALRRRAPLLAGFDVWRMPAAAARVAGFDTQSPRPDQLMAQARRINDLPIAPRRHFTQAEAEAARMDPGNAFVTDVGPAETRWQDGDEFAWFVVARDRLDQPGEVSLAGFGFVCASFPPDTPRGLRADNIFTAGAAATTQAISLQWDRPMTNTPLVSRFQIYRGESELPPVASTNEPPPGAQIAEVPADAAAIRYQWVDASLNPTVNTNLYGRGFWYAIRAVRETQCGEVSSALSPPVWVNIRRYNAPDAPTGDLGIHCPRVVVLAPDDHYGSERVDPPDPGDRHYRLSLQRRDLGVAWAEVVVTTGWDAPAQIVSPRLRFAEGVTNLNFDFRLSRLAGTTPTPMVQVIAGSFTGAESDPRVFPLPPEVPADAMLIAVVPTGTVSTADPILGDPYYQDVLLGPFPLSDVARTTNGMLMARSPTSSEQVLIEAADLTTPPEGDWRFVTMTRPVFTARTDGPWLVFADPALAPDQDPLRTFIYRAWILQPPRTERMTPCAHVPRSADSQSIHPIKVRMTLTPRTKLWRMYRQVNDAPLTLFAEGTGEFIPGSVQSIVEATDDVMPVGAARLCYFGQVADENGNWSPLGPLGCEDILPRELPVPLLARPEPEGDMNSPVMRLRWFCPPDGVANFQIILKTISGSVPGQGVSAVTAPLKTVLVTTAKPVAWYSTETITALKKSLIVSSMFLTGPVGTEPAGSALGPGPDFTFAVDVQANVTYEVQVAAVDARGNAGHASHIQRFTWTVPRPLVDRDVPWPQRPLPDVGRIHSNLTAVVLSDQFMIWPFPTNAYAVGVRIGRIPIGQREFPQDLIGLPNGEHGGRMLRLLATRSAVASGRGLESLLFSDELSRPPRPEFRPLNVVLYRRQMPSAEFPEVSGDVVQVSPLLREVAHWKLPDNSGFELLDPMLGLTVISTIPDSTVTQPFTSVVDVHLLDLHPVVRGARYRYWLVHFTALGEPDQTIPAGEVEVPL